MKLHASSPYRQLGSICTAESYKDEINETTNTLTLNTCWASELWKHLSKFLGNALVREWLKTQTHPHNYFVSFLIMPKINFRLIIKLVYPQINQV